MSQFVGYHLEDHESTVPVATGTDRDETQALTVRRILGAGITYGEMAVQSRDDLSGEDFAKLTEVTNTFWAAKGLE